VGDNLRNIAGVPNLVFGAMQDVKVQMISQGASAVNITFVIDQDQLPDTVRNLHDAFFRKVDPRIFE
jgi:aspartate kinase